MAIFHCFLYVHQRVPGVAPELRTPPTALRAKVLGVADGVSQIEDFGIDASLLPNELLQVVEQLGMHQFLGANMCEKPLLE